MSAESLTVDPFKKAVRDAWDSGATTYDTYYGHGLRQGIEHDAWLRFLRRLMLPEDRLSVLDVGTGTGVIALLCAELGHSVTAIDISEGMMSVAREKATGAGLNVAFHPGDAEDPPFGPEAFDVVISRHVLWTLPEPERAARAWKRLLTPGGRVIVLDALWPNTVSEKVSIVAGNIINKVLRRNEVDHVYTPDIYARLPLTAARTLDPHRNVFLRAGFKDVRTEELEHMAKVLASIMPLGDRLTGVWRMYLLEATV
jgi:ubiquinone/menaquinone biosynthesis C-methylase UbiE